MKKIREAIETGESPDIIHPSKRSRVEGGQLGYEPLMPKRETTHEIASKAYQRAMERLSRYIPPEKMPHSDEEFVQLLMGMMNTLEEIKDIENSHIEYLEHLAVQTVLGLPEFEAAKKAIEAGDLRIEAELIRATVNVDRPEEMEQELEDQIQTPEFNNFEQEMEYMMANIEQERMKRKFSNVMIQGAAVSYMYLFEFVRNELSEINPHLSDMYGFMSSVGDMAYWVMPEMNLGDMGAAEAGSEEVEQDEEGAGVIKAKAVIFPLLMHEIVKGLMEYATTHGLPQSKEITKQVTSQTDTPENEVYDIMLGPAFWKHLTDAIDPKNANLLYHVWGKIVSLPAVDADIKDSFAGFIKEFLKSPESAKRIVSSFVSDIEKSIQEYESTSEDEPIPTFESYQLLIHEALTNMLRGILAKYPKMTEEEFERWVAVDPTKNGINVPVFMILKNEKKIKKPEDILRIINDTTYIPNKTKLGPHKAVIEVPLTPQEREEKIKENANQSLPWVLKQIKSNQLKYPEDLPHAKNALHTFYKFKNTKHWPQGAPIDLYKYPTFADLSAITSKVVMALYGSQMEKRAEIKPDTELMGVEPPFELIRIFPTRRGQLSLHEYTLVGGKRYASWCVGFEPTSSGWSYFVNYLKLNEIPGFNEKKETPENIKNNPMYSFYYVAKDGLPYAAFEFRSNYFMNIHDSEGRNTPEYNNVIRGLITRSIPGARDIVNPNVSAKPSSLLKSFIAKYPTDIAKMIICRLLHFKKTTNKEPFEVLKEPDGARKFTTTTVIELTNRLRESFVEKDKNWKESLSTWGKYAANVPATAEGKSILDKSINLDVPEVKQALTNLASEIQQNTISCDDVQDLNLKFEDALLNKLNSMSSELKSTVTEGSLAKTLGKAALVGALSFANPKEGETAPKTPPSEITQTLTNNSQKIQHNILARTIWAEAQNEGEEGMRAVASVIFTRGRGNIDQMIQAIKKPKQFSCWNAMSPEDWQHFVVKEKSGKEWDIAKQIASELIQNTFKPTIFATHYYNPKKANPSWAYSNDKIRSYKMIGKHRFMRIKE